MKPVAIALDLGSTSIKAGLLDQSGQLQGVVSQPAPPLQVEGNRYESDALAYAAAADAVLSACLAQTTRRPPLGICCQRSSFLIWERASGVPVTPLISWQDGRGAASCAALQQQENEIAQLSGLRLTPYYFAPKLRVMLAENPAWRDKLLRGEWLVGTLDSFLIWRWTDGRHHIIDVSMAARTLLLDIDTQQWSRQLCALFDIPQSILPQIRNSSGLQLYLKNGLTLAASLADQSAALLATVGTRSDVVLVNLGTGGFVIRLLQPEQAGPSGYLRTLVLQQPGAMPQYASEGTLNSIASALAPYPASQCVAEQLGQHADIFCLAEPSGIGAPYFRKALGLQFSHNVDHLAAPDIAALLIEGIIFRVARIIHEFDQQGAVNEVYLSGGLSELSCIQQGLAQCVKQPVYRLQQHEASLQGAAMLACGEQAGISAELKQFVTSKPDSLLANKFGHWSNWLDTLTLQSDTFRR